MGKHHFIKLSSEVFILLLLFSMSFGNEERYILKLSIGHKKAIKMLVERGANVNAVDGNERLFKMTPLHYIALFDTSNRGHEDWTEDDRCSN